MKNGAYGHFLKSVREIRWLFLKSIGDREKLHNFQFKSEKTKDIGIKRRKMLLCRILDGFLTANPKVQAKK